MVARKERGFWLPGHMPPQTRHGAQIADALLLLKL